MPQRGVAVSRGDRRYRDDPALAPGSDRDRRRSDARTAATGDRDRDRQRAATRTVQPAADAVRYAAGAGVPGRRTVTIRGQGAERYVPARSRSSRRRPERRYERTGFRPDRAAMWAVLLGLMLILAAVTSAHAATLHALSHLH
jgi:hypothetical protein